MAVQAPAQSKPQPQNDLVTRYVSQAGDLFARTYEKIMAGERISRAEGIEIYNSHDLLAIGILADTARIVRTPEAERNYVYWVHNFHINPTNICEASCRFCSFKKGPGSPFAYIMSVDDVIEHVNKYPGKDSLSEFHIVSGLYREQSLDYYSKLFKALRREFPHVHIKGLTAVELAFFAQVEGIPVEQVLDTLIEAGLGSLPGGGAEVFAERVRKEVCVDKIPAEEWLRIHGLAHQRGLKSNATLLAGLGETPEERIDHMLAIRDQQDLTGGFMTFIPLNCYYEKNAVDAKHALTGVENLKNFALSRILLDNVPHIKSFWIHLGEKITQVSLSFGVDDIDGTVIEEKIAHAAGTEASEALTKDELLNLIRRAGKTPVERDTTYNLVKIYDDHA
ncbi:MAG: CofH family radical SAM protein [Candidatus Melainabacteria bacterium]